MNDQELDKILNALKEEDAQHLGSVSRRVMLRIEEGQLRRRLLWIPLAAAAMIAALVLWIPRKPEQRLSVQQPPAPTAPAMAWINPKPQVVVRTARLKKPKPKAGPLEVRLETDDPDVLIIWLVDGDEEQKGNR